MNMPWSYCIAEALTLTKIERVKFVVKAKKINGEWLYHTEIKH